MASSAHWGGNQEQARSWGCNSGGQGDGRASAGLWIAKGFYLLDLIREGAGIGLYRSAQHLYLLGRQVEVGRLLTSAPWILR